MFLLAREKLKEKKEEFHTEDTSPILRIGAVYTEFHGGYNGALWQI